MNEASKTNNIRGPQFLATYLSGKVIDIGSGVDPVVPNAEPFDLQQGDANEIEKYRPAGHYDCVHSSHCLEHMHNPEKALAGWWKLVKPGGYLVVVVPHEDLYEQGFWPSLFNPDHKATFRLGKSETWSPVSFDMLDLARGLPEGEVISAELHDQNYDYARKMAPTSRKSPRVYRLARHYFARGLRAILNRTPIEKFRFWPSIERGLPRIGIPIDQTRGDASAQIQIVVRKRQTAS